MNGSDSDRNESLEKIRRTYRGYREVGRDRLWDVANLGYARMIRDRDRALVQLICHSMPAGGPILDIGSGLGELADLIRAEVHEVSWTGVDLLPEVIAESRSLRPWATWIEASADRLPFSAASFEVVVASTLFSSLVSRQLERAAAAELGRVLLPGGWLVWYDLRYDNPRNPQVHRVERAALAKLFPGWHQELRTMTLLPPMARRLGRLTSLAYRPLELIPPLRSHLVGRLQRPA